ncbi:PEP-CTERM putative exosortase interaction domain-containing protein [Methylophilaceae bacterium 11]|nr:PEP-CTERM putative exosortase interaction domain-containing protein [Methylophilaceae bacterium 11]
MNTQILKQAVLGALFAVSSVAANAATVTFNFDYLANNGTPTAATSSALPKGDFATASGGTATSVGTITFTDLSDLNLGDGASGVRTTISLNGLNQFSSGTGSIFISSFEINFAGTENLTNDSFRTVSGLATSGIEFAEGGTLSSSGVGNNWGNNPSNDPAWEQEINFTAGAFVNGQFSTLDFLNGEEGYNGFSVAALLANAVDSQNAGLPNAYAWIRVRSTGLGIANDGSQWWGTPSFNAAGGRLDVLAVTAVPEPETYAMFLAGLGLMGAVARRRKQK